MKRVKFSYPNTLQTIIDLCHPSVVGSKSIRTYIRKPKEQQKNEELPQPNLEKTLNEAASTIHAVEFTFGSLDPKLKKKIEEKGAKIRDLHQKILEKGKALHLGCDSEIQYWRSQIKYL